MNTNFRYSNLFGLMTSVNIETSRTSGGLKRTGTTRCGESAWCEVHVCKHMLQDLAGLSRIDDPNAWTSLPRRMVVARMKKLQKYNKNTRKHERFELT